MEKYTIFNNRWEVCGYGTNLQEATDKANTWTINKNEEHYIAQLIQIHKPITHIGVDVQVVEY